MYSAMDTPHNYRTRASGFRRRRRFRRLKPRIAQSLTECRASSAPSPFGRRAQAEAAEDLSGLDAHLARAVPLLARSWTMRRTAISRIGNCHAVRNYTSGGGASEVAHAAPTAQQAQGASGQHMRVRCQFTKLKKDRASQTRRHTQRPTQEHWRRSSVGPRSELDSSCRGDAAACGVRKGKDITRLRGFGFRSL